MTTPIRKVLDISHHNDVSSWDDVVAAGIVGVIHKATEGTGYSDPDRATNCANALKAGLAVCTYHFLKHAPAKLQ